MGLVKKKIKHTALSWDQEYKTHVDYLKLLCDELSGDKTTNIDVFMVCLGIGFKIRNDIKFVRRAPTGGNDVGAIGFINPYQQAIMYAIALVDTDDSDLLLDDDEIYYISEKYAAMGLMYIDDLIKSGKSLRIELQNLTLAEYKKSLNL